VKIVKIVEDIFRNTKGDPPNPSPDLGPGLPDALKPYENQIETQDLPNANRRVYRCNKCSNSEWYYDPGGILESHFKHNHTEVGQ
jgi:hypothetical protein